MHAQAAQVHPMKAHEHSKIAIKKGLILTQQRSNSIVGLGEKLL
jgi:hypothetical protein